MACLLPNADPRRAHWRCRDYVSQLQKFGGWSSVWQHKCPAGQISSSSDGMVLNLNVQDCSFHVLGFG